jgi:type IV pilus assembly protein PilM
MAKSAGVWGIDIGRCALKALRCHLDGEAVVADAFDYIEYPKLLTQPEADAPQLIKEALEQFLSRNSVKGDRVAVSVSGESGLARYFKPPPVDVKKIADIVKYEARQQIPFALEDVIWDFQRMAGGQEVDGFALDTEIGLFAMKREAVAKALTPYNIAGIEVDVIQLAPIAIYNYIARDLAKELPAGEEYNSENPPTSYVVLSIGTDTTDLVVTNGYRLWQRNIPLGGNHFTKQLSKELKLTFAKAEHLKRNPKQAEDPKAIFQAMRPVFADMVTEVQRSIGFFQSLDRKAKIGSVVTLGNTVKLPGLVQYLSKHLGYDIKEIESFNKLSGTSVVTAPSFKDNVFAFATGYGLCLQALGKGKLSTNLLPREIITQRLIRAKKPWAVAGVSALMLACAINYAQWQKNWYEVHPDRNMEGRTWKEAVEKAKTVAAHSAAQIAEDSAEVAALDVLKKIGTEVVGSADRRLLWLEVMKAINKSLPAMKDGHDAKAPTPDVKTLPFVQRKDLKIQYIETQYFQDLSLWFNDTVKEKYLQLHPELTKNPLPADPNAPPPDPSLAAAAPPAADPAMAAPPDAGLAGGMPGGMPGGDGYGAGTGLEMGPQTDLAGVTIPNPPTGPGWIVEIRGYHYYNDPKDRANSGAAHVRNTLIKELENGFVEVPGGPGQPLQRFTMKELGIGFPIQAYNPPIQKIPLANPNFVSPAKAAAGSATGGLGGTAGGFGGAAGGFGAPVNPNDPTAVPFDPENPPYFEVTRYDFVIQFVWQEKPLNVRLEARRQKLLEAQQAAEAAAAAQAAQAADGSAPAPSAELPPPGNVPAAVPSAPAAPPAATPPDAAGAPSLPSPAPAPPVAAPLPAGPPDTPVAARYARPGQLNSWPAGQSQQGARNRTAINEELNSWTNSRRNSPWSSSTRSG